MAATGTLSARVSPFVTELGLNGRPVWFNSATPNCRLGPGPLRHWQPEPSVSSCRITQTRCVALGELSFWLALQPTAAFPRLEQWVGFRGQDQRGSQPAKRSPPIGCSAPVAGRRPCQVSAR
jgi:hypothetical protein